MLDFVYIAGTVVFFALMLGYVNFCRSLGGATRAEEPRHDA